jgi:oligosaccharide repeat unit polymerase
MLRVLALVITMLFFGVAARVTERNWTAPTVFFSLLWGFYVLSALYFMIDAEVMVAGTLWIALACGSVYLGTLVAHLDPGRGPSVRIAAGSVLHFPFLRFLAIAGIMVGLAQLVFMFARQGFSLRSVLSYAAIGQLTAMNRGEFIYGDREQTFAEQIGLLCLYFAALVGGFLFKTAASRRDRVLGAMNLVLPTVVPSLYGSRMGLLYGGSFWVASYIAARVLQHGREGDGKFFLQVGGLAVTLLLVVQVLVQVVRYSTERDPVPLFKMVADPFGFLAAFVEWFDRAGWQFSHFTVGARTFRRIVAVVGIAEPPLPAVGVGFTSSNIYTVLRDLIEDFGTIGGLIVLFAYGYCARFVHVRVRGGDARYLGLLALTFAFTLTSFSVSIFFYTAPMLAVVAFALYCFAFARARGGETPQRDLLLGPRSAPVFRLGRADPRSGV